MAAFPNQGVTLAIAGDGSLDATPTEAAATTIAMTRAKWPGRLIVQINSLSTFNPAAPGEPDSPGNLLWNSRPDVGAQMLSNVHGDSDCRVNNGCGPSDLTVLSECVDSAVSYGVNFIEIYETDVLNVPEAITYARQKLTATSTPTPTDIPTPTPTPTETPTPTPSSSPTPTPTPSPTPISFQMDDAPDAAGPLQQNSGLPIYAAVRGGVLYVATSSPGNDGPNDQFIFVTDSLLGSAMAPAPWLKQGMIASESAKPFVGGESWSEFCGWFNAPVTSVAVKSPTGSGVMEATIDLAAAFVQSLRRSMLRRPLTKRRTAAHWWRKGRSGTAIQTSTRMSSSLSVTALADENGDGIYDRLDPALGFVVTEITRADGVVTVTCPAVPGWTYQAESSGKLGGEWLPLHQAVTAAPGQLVLSTNDDTAEATRFYRVRLVTP